MSKESTSVESKDSMEVEQVIKVAASKPQIENASEDLPLQESDKEITTPETKMGLKKVMANVPETTAGFSIFNPQPSIHKEQTKEKIPTPQEFTREILDHDITIGPTQIERGQEHPSNQEIPMDDERVRTILGRMLGRIIGKKAASYVEEAIRYILDPGRWFLTLIKKK